MGTCSTVRAACSDCSRRKNRWITHAACITDICEGMQRRLLAQYSTAQHSTAQHSTAQHSTAQHSTAQHSTAQHSTAQHSTAQHSTRRLNGVDDRFADGVLCRVADAVAADTHGEARWDLVARESKQGRHRGLVGVAQVHAPAPAVTFNTRMTRSARHEVFATRCLPRGVRDKTVSEQVM
jgi:hypothetical protein